MVELQNFKGYFLDTTGKLFHSSTSQGFVLKSAYYKGKTLGYKLKGRFISIKQLKTEPVLQESLYHLPF